MASLGTTPAHVSSNSYFRRRSTFNIKQRCVPITVRCSLQPPIRFHNHKSRRSLSISIALSSFLLTFPNRALAEGNIFDKYVKRKKLDPLEAYVPAVILTQFQIKDLEKTIEGDEPQFGLCRSLLRSGPAASLRVNIRAMAQYAFDSGNGKTAFNKVDECLRSLEELDSLLLHASRKDPKASVKSMKDKINTALTAIDSLLQTVPSDVLSKGKVIADSYRDPAEVEIETLDPNLKQLESIL
ncbi:hypothetical protein HN51_059594 [Arachis hypogaea]|uniref:DUF7880 domain-containing protein n=1 Tax=Arachis hypogaea TaxID=3818 RepID=A0A444X6N6_ARAHY|nr:uncharacterized protein LOC107621575 [Arachis ipaensis]XP_025684271.1 uncharacterized protein LOC112785077 [Arachis hypogaea]QHN83032.1 uncharacterized protein DS421_20g701070 [Arachis hypogaea]RYQ85233.1 hypothetical protein Ahy_B10g104734 [Arachis hypogaea]